MSDSEYTRGVESSPGEYRWYKEMVKESAVYRPMTFLEKAGLFKEYTLSRGYSLKIALNYAKNGEVMVKEAVTEYVLILSVETTW